MGKEWNVWSNQETLEDRTHDLCVRYYNQRGPGKSQGQASELKELNSIVVKQPHLTAESPYWELDGIVHKTIDA